jgi:hypothetical protein
MMAEQHTQPCEMDDPTYLRFWYIERVLLGPAAHLQSSLNGVEMLGELLSTRP